MKETKTHKAEHQPDLITLLNSQVQCVLATLFNGQPQQHLMAYACAAEQSSILMMSFQHTRKVSNISASQNVSLLWDNRTGNCQDHTEGWCLSAQGQAVIRQPSDPNYDFFRQIFLTQNTNLHGLANHPDGVLIHITVEQFFLTIGYQDSYQLNWPS